MTYHEAARRSHDAEHEHSTQTATFQAVPVEVTQFDDVPGDSWQRCTVRVTSTWQVMSVDPWTAPDPQPGDFDEELATIDAADVEHHAGNPDARTRILLTVEGEDAERLTRVAEARGQSRTDVIAELLRDADRPAA